jgi:arylformamidase
MKIYDISLPISPSLPVWPGDPVEAMDNGAHANVSRLAASVHVGTHVDAPHHFLNDGRMVEALPLNVLTGPCTVVEIPHEAEHVTAEILQRIALPRTERLLLKSRNSARWALETEFFPDFLAISPDGARFLVDHGVRLVGVDYLSVAPYEQSVPTHTILLQAGVIVVEGLNLAEVPPGAYDLYCLPLKLVGSDGAPARTILIERG